MGQITSTFRRDGNGVPIGTDGIIVTKTIAYDGSAGKGAIGATTLFTVVGDVLVNIFAICSEDLVSAGAGTVEVGISGNTAALIAQTTATTIDLGEVWVDNSPATVETLPSAKILTNSTNIIETIAAGAVTDGTITYYCAWRPLSASADVS